MATHRPILSVAAHEAEKLTDHNFLVSTMTTVLARLIPDFVQIESLGATFYKRRYVRPDHYQFVIGCLIKYETKNSSQILDCVIGSASDGSKRMAFDNLCYLWDQGFSTGTLRVTEPLCYIEGIEALIYRATPGTTLFQHICHRPPAEQLKPAFSLAAAWLRKLHEVSKPSFTLATSEDIAHLLEIFKKSLPSYRQHSSSQGDKLAQVITHLETMAPQFSQTANLVYGDFHPENIILLDLSASELVMIDFSDLGLGNPYRDVGTFIQQFDFMCQMYLPRGDINNLKKYFISQYCQRPYSAITTDLLQPINYYQAVAALRSSVWLFPGLSRTAALGLLDDARLLLEKVAQGQHSINLR